MARTRPTRSASRSSPVSSPASAKSGSKSKPKSTPTATVKRSSSLRQSTTPASRQRAHAKKTNGRAKPAKSVRDELEHSPTGLTPTPSPSSSDAGSEDAFDPPSSDEDDVIEELEAEAESDVDSDNLDEDDESDFGRGKAKKRKSNGGGGGGGAVKKVKTTPTAKKNGNGNGKFRIEGYEDEDEEDDEEVELEEGQEIAGRIYPAPKTGQVPAGQISQNTFNFLKNLQIPERNDRDWLRAHEPAFRQAEKEWQAFVGVVQHNFHGADEDIPILPPKDVIHRIYRDVRFSSDKTPYKRNFSMSTSRGGRKGVWAGYYLQICPNDKSMIACGVWQPGKNELQTMRHHLMNEPERFRATIGHPDFVRLFGPPKAHPKGKRQNVFGRDDALKVAPKGVGKDHKDIDLLKLRSVAVMHEFNDEDVLSENFGEKIGEVVAVMAPFAHMLNDFVALPGTMNGNSGNDGGAEDDGEDGEEEEDEEE